jgi:hypothetical protein
MSRSLLEGETIPMKNSSQHLIAEVTRRHYCTLNQGGEVVDRGRFRTTPKAIEKLGHEVIVTNIRELRAISHSDPKTTRSMPRSWPATHVSIRTF